MFLMKINIKLIYAMAQGEWRGDMEVHYVKILFKKCLNIIGFNIKIINLIQEEVDGRVC